jgi:hypothetical protein
MEPLHAAPRHRAPVGCNGIKGSKLKVRNKKKKKKARGLVSAQSSNDTEDDGVHTLGRLASVDSVASSSPLPTSSMDRFRLCGDKTVNSADEVAVGSAA